MEYKISIDILSKQAKEFDKARQNLEDDNIEQLKFYTKAIENLVCAIAICERLERIAEQNEKIIKNTCHPVLLGPGSGHSVH